MRGLRCPPFDLVDNRADDFVGSAWTLDPAASLLRISGRPFRRVSSAVAPGSELVSERGMRRLPAELVARPGCNRKLVQEQHFGEHVTEAGAGFVGGTRDGALRSHRD